MKKLLCMISILSLLLLAACDKAPQSESADPDTLTTGNSPSTTISTSTSPDNDPALFTELFSDLSGWYNAALTSEYTEPAKINLKLLFNLGFSDESRAPTDAEWAELEGQPGFDENFDLFRLPAEQMDAVLTQYFGITLEEMDESAFDGLVYLESTDCYYFMGTGAHRIEGFCLVRTAEQDDGTIQIEYTSDSGVSGIVTVYVTSDGRVLICANQYT